MTKTPALSDRPALTRLTECARRSGIGIDALEGAIRRGDAPGSVRLRLIGHTQTRYVTNAHVLHAWLVGDKLPQQDDCADLFTTENTNG